MGRIRGSAPSDLARTRLPPWFDEFLMAHPGVHLDLSIGNRTADIVKDELDLASGMATWPTRGWSLDSSPRASKSWPLHRPT
ncbi:hypothetical protein DBR42_27305 [Pelomonas sp. HMWF004]|nr:hypothetical protein DBR42_27305 [Pelomonas sp. HMWF004]